jgi:mono/diheme cytochrome c family protein
MKKVIATLVLTCAATAAFLQTSLQQQLSAGRQAYNKYCLQCHQADGGGVPGLNPPLSKTEWVLGNKTTLINVVLKGMTDGVEIDGDLYTNPMPAQANLTDKEIADVLTYVRNSFGNKASAISEAEVRAARAKSK